MDSGHPGGGGGAESTATVSASAAATSALEDSAAAIPARKPRWSAEIKVYARRYPGRKLKPHPDPNPSPPPEALTLAPEAAAPAEPIASPSTAVPAAESAAPRSPSPPHRHPEAAAPATGVAPPSLVVPATSPAAPPSPVLPPSLEAAVPTAEVAPPSPASSPPSAHLPSPEAAAPSSPSPHHPSPEAAAPSAPSPRRPSPEAAAPSSPSPHRPSPEAAAPSSPSPHRPSPKAATPADEVAPPSPAIPEAAQPPLPSSSTPALAPAAPPEDTTAAVICIDTSSGLNCDGGGSGGAIPNGVEVRARDAGLKRKERRELRRHLAAELEQVRTLGKQLDAAADALAVATASVPALPRPPALLLPAAPVEAGYVRSQFSATGPGTLIPTPGAAVTPGRSLVQRWPLTVSVVPTESFEKEKRTPKANQYYHNSEFLLAKDRFPPADSHGHKKSKHHKKHHSLSADAAGFAAERRLYSHPLKKCESLLGRIMKHRFGWVFNKPVDPVKLGLHDYFLIIKHPMDLGTIKGLLNRGQYRNPREFAEDVRLTFHNAMTYNPKGQDVHFMAEQLLGIFEAQWPEIEAEVEYLASCPPFPKKFPPPPIDLRVLERSDSTMHRMLLDSKSKPISHTPPYSARTPASKKPKAKDPDKRDMTPEEKQKLSNNLQNLPIEKLNIVVQIIKNKNLSVRHNDDEIEVDIDSMDAETLWELDRFVTNYKKNLSKNKRKAELARQNAEMHAQQRSQEPNTGESPKQNEMAEEQLATSVPAQDGNNGGNINRSSSSSGSSSESGSSSSDSDSDSSSADGPDAANVS